MQVGIEHREYLFLRHRLGAWLLLKPAVVIGDERNTGERQRRFTGQ